MMRNTPTPETHTAGGVVSMVNMDNAYVSAGVANRRRPLGCCCTRAIILCVIMNKYGDDLACMMCAIHMGALLL